MSINVQFDIQPVTDASEPITTYVVETSNFRVQFLDRKKARTHALALAKVEKVSCRKEIFIG